MLCGLCGGLCAISLWLNCLRLRKVSVFFVDEGIDSGPIIIQKKIAIKDYSQQELIFITKKIGMEAIAEAVDKIKKDNFTLIKNDASKKTYYSFPTRSDVKDFMKKGKRFY